MLSECSLSRNQCDKFALNCASENLIRNKNSTKQKQAINIISIILKNVSWAKWVAELRKQIARVEHKFRHCQTLIWTPRIDRRSANKHVRSWQVDESADVIYKRRPPNNDMNNHDSS